jgi:endonuclease/exonuclease/phosphatase family metal-dependent hydrolase
MVGMKRVLGIVVGGVLCLLAAARGVAVESNELVVVQWNVENLFDTADDPGNRGDDEYTSRGWERWTDALYRQKLRHLVEVLGPLNADILCFQEVENRRVLDDLRALLNQKHGLSYPYVVHREGSDHRGIDVAMLSRVEPRDARWTIAIPGLRDLLTVEFGEAGETLAVLVNHWKSRAGKREDCDAKRAVMARGTREEVDRILTTDPDAAIVVLGDFNDEFDGEFVAGTLRGVTNREQVVADVSGGWLYNLHAELSPVERGTLYYAKGKRWSAFDSVNVNRELLGVAGDSNGGWRVMLNSYAVIRHPWMLDELGQPKPFRRDRKSKTSQFDYVTGYSDHLPVMFRLERVAPPPAMVATP